MTDKPKMAPRADAPPGIETDGKGNLIPFEKRTPEDQARTDAAVAAALHGSVKDPDGDAIAPASMPIEQQAGSKAPRANDIAGNQGGQLGGGPDVIQHR